MADSGLGQFLPQTGFGGDLKSLFGNQNFMGGMGQFFGGLTGNSGAPYQAGMDQLQKYFSQAQGLQNPFYNAGTQAIPQYQNWVNSMSHPTDFINGMMNQYQESPWAKFQQQQGIRSAQNIGSANGLANSTPMTQFAQQNAQNISSQDMNQWLQNVLGVNTQYGSGLNNQMNMGQNAANSMTNMLSQMGNSMAQGAYGQSAGQQQDHNNIIGGLMNMF